MTRLFFMGLRRSHAQYLVRCLDCTGAPPAYGTGQYVADGDELASNEHHITNRVRHDMLQTHDVIEVHNRATGAPGEDDGGGDHRDARPDCEAEHEGHEEPEGPPRGAAGDRLRAGVRVRVSMLGRILSQSWGWGCGEGIGLGRETGQLHRVRTRTSGRARSTSECARCESLSNRGAVCLAFAAGHESDKRLELR